MASVDLSSINVLAELERIGWNLEPTGEDEVRVRCPFHEDETPSCSINVESKLFKCHAAGCGAKGDFLSFLARALRTTRRVVFEDLKTRYPLSAVKAIDPAVVEKYHRAVWDSPMFLKALRQRGVTDDLIRKHRFGVDRGRITIPIYDDAGRVVNVRRYLPGAPGNEKMRNTRGRGRVRLYPAGQLGYDRMVVCGGELKAVVAGGLLNPHGVGAVTATAGEGNWESEFSALFRDKVTYVCFDVDDAGIIGADRVLARLRGDARWVGKVALPLSLDEYPHGDVNDWVGLEDATSKDFLALLEATEEWVPTTVETFEADGEFQDVHLSAATRAEYTGERVRVRAVVSAMDTAPYVIPSRVRVMCDRNQHGCSNCPVYVLAPDKHGWVEMPVPTESPSILEMVARPKVAQRDALMLAFRIPDCKGVSFQPTQWCNVDDVRLSPQLEIAERAAEHLMLPALCVGHGLETNETFQLVGRMFPHPQTQQSVLLISEYQATADALSAYQPTLEDLEPLRRLQPHEWTVDGLGQVLDELYEDLETNVTRIFMRRDLHFMADLAYHSVLLLEFDGRLEKGWAEVLVLGDSAQGKSETVTQLMRHYGLGEKVECKNATVAGLLGGLQQLGNRWFVTWGVIPTHDKRLVVLEEIKGAPTEVLAKLTDMRSSGVAEIPKIEKRRTHARTRLIALSNPRSDQPLSSYSFGVEAVKELMGGLEDVRRFDAILLVSSDELDAATLNQVQRERPRVEHRFTDGLCRQCVLWAWTREPSQVRFEEAATAAALDEATRLCEIFTELIPIVDRGSMRLKLARLAAALACRTFSCGDDLQTVVVRACHVQYVSQFLERVYSSPTFGYLDYSRAVETSRELLQPDFVKSHILQTPFIGDFIDQMLNTSEIELRDICDWCGWDKGEGIRLLSFLVRKHALLRDGRAYRKTPSFIALLKSMRGSPEVAAAARPDHIGEEL